MTLQREVEAWQALGVDAEIVDPQRAAAFHPLLDVSTIAGALVIPASYYGRAQAIPAVEGIARRAINSGAQFLERATVTALEPSPDGGWVVSTAERGCFGPVDHVVVACGAWTPDILGLASVRLPVAAVRHPYVVSEPIAQLKRSAWPSGAAAHLLHAHQNYPSSLPGVWDADTGLYFQQFGDRIGYGSYGHAATVVPPADVSDTLVSQSTSEEPARFPYQSHLHREASVAARTLLPTLSAEHSFEGLMTYAPDGAPVVGPCGGKDGVSGLWTACCTCKKHARVVCVHKCVYLCVCVCACVYVCACVCVCMCVCVCVCVFVEFGQYQFRYIIRHGARGFPGIIRTR